VAGAPKESVVTSLGQDRVRDQLLAPVGDGDAEQAPLRHLVHAVAPERHVLGLAQQAAVAEGYTFSGASATSTSTRSCTPGSRQPGFSRPRRRWWRAACSAAAQAGARCRRRPSADTAAAPRPTPPSERSQSVPDFEAVVLDGDGEHNAAIPFPTRRRMGLSNAFPGPPHRG
jgi:hypothetical protein